MELQLFVLNAALPSRFDKYENGWSDTTDLPKILMTFLGSARAARQAAVPRHGSLDDQRSLLDYPVLENFPGPFSAFLSPVVASDSSFFCMLGQSIFSLAFQIFAIFDFDIPPYTPSILIYYYFVKCYVITVSTNNIVVSVVVPNSWFVGDTKTGGTVTRQLKLPRMQLRWSRPIPPWSSTTSSRFADSPQCSQRR